MPLKFPSKTYIHNSPADYKLRSGRLLFRSTSDYPLLDDNVVHRNVSCDENFNLDGLAKSRQSTAKIGLQTTDTLLSQNGSLNTVLVFTLCIQVVCMCMCMRVVSYLMCIEKITRRLTHKPPLHFIHSLAVPHIVRHKARGQ